MTSSSPEPLRAVVVGAGLMGRWHGDAALHAGGTVTAVVDTDAARARALADRHPGAIVTSDLEAAARDTNPQVVHVCTPLATHQALARCAITLGLHTVVEKPLTADAAGAHALLDLAAAHRVHVVPTHQFLFQRGVTGVLERLASLGPLRHVETVACTAGADRGGGGAGGGEPDARDTLVAEILPHPLALFARVLGQPVAGLAWHVERAAAGEVRATARSGETVLSLLISTAGRPTRNELRIVGERGSATVDLFHGFAVFEGAGSSRGAKIARPFAVASRTLLTAAANLARRAARAQTAYPGLRELVRAVYGAIRSGGTPPITPAETLDVAAARDAILTCAAAPAG